MREGAREWSVMKRYSSIRSFVLALKKHNDYTVPATFPPKVIGKVNIDDRRVGLEWYLRALLREPSLRSQPAVQRFLGETDAEITGELRPDVRMSMEAGEGARSCLLHAAVTSSSACEWKQTSARQRPASNPASEWKQAKGHL